MSFDKNYKDHDFQITDEVNNYICNKCSSIVYFYRLPEDYYSFDRYVKTSDFYNKLTCDEIIVKNIIE